MVNLVTIRDGPTLVPATRYDLEVLDGVNSSRPLRTSLTFSTDEPLRRWYWSFITIVAEGIGVPVQSLHRDLKFKAGLIESIFLSQSGLPVVELKSTAKRRMDGIEFGQYVELCKELVFRDYLPGVTRKLVYQRVEQMAAPLPR